MCGECDCAGLRGGADGLSGGGGFPCPFREPLGATAGRGGGAGLCELTSAALSA